MQHLSTWHGPDMYKQEGVCPRCGYHPKAEEYDRNGDGYELCVALLETTCPQCHLHGAAIYLEDNWEPECPTDFDHETDLLDDEIVADENGPRCVRYTLWCNDCEEEFNHDCALHYAMSYVAKDRQDPHSRGYDSDEDFEFARKLVLEAMRQGTM